MFKMKINFGKVIIFLLITICFIPRQEISYLLPFIILFLCLTITGFKIKLSGVNKFYLFAWSLFFLFAILSSCLNLSNPINFAFAFITYFSSVAAFFTVFLFPYNKNHLKYAVTLIIFFAVLQFPIGTYQIYKGVNFSVLNPFSESIGAGDAFVGTVGRNSHLLAVMGAFAFTLTSFLWWNVRKNVLILLCFITLMVWLLPSAVHTIVISIVTILSIICIKLFKQLVKLFMNAKITIKKRDIAVAVFALIIISGATAITQMGNIYYGYSLISRVFLPDKSFRPRKIEGFYNTVFELPKYKFFAPLIGVGFGSYSSRAALITSGEYLSYQPSFIPITPSEETKKFIVSLWNRELLKDRWAHGVSNQPFSTWQSLYGEIGFLGLFLFIAVFYKNLKVFSFLSENSKDAYIRSVAQGMKLFTIFLFFLFFMDNWFEYSQVMIPYWVTAGLLVKKFSNSAYRITTPKHIL